jgi:hypothetical protein
MRDLETRSIISAQAARQAFGASDRQRLQRKAAFNTRSRATALQGDCCPWPRRGVLALTGAKRS